MEKPRPRLGCAVVVFDEEKILLGVRGKEPNYGKIIIPGGGVDFLEPLKKAGMREIREETGLEIELETLIGLYEIITPPNEHRVIAYYRARKTGGTLKASSDLLDAKFYTRQEVQTLVDQGKTPNIITRVLTDIGWYTPKH